MNDFAIFEAVSKTIFDALKDTFNNSSSKKNIAKTEKELKFIGKHPSQQIKLTETKILRVLL